MPIGVMSVAVAKMSAKSASSEDAGKIKSNSSQFNRLGLRAPTTASSATRALESIVAIARIWGFGGGLTSHRLTAKQAGEKAAVFDGFQFGFEADAFLDEVGLLFD